MLGPVEGFRIDADFTAIWHVESDLELSFSGAQRKQEGIAILFFLRYGSRVDGLSPGGHGHALLNLGAVGKIELEALVAHLGAWWIGSIIDREQADTLQLVALRLKPHHVSGYADPFDFLR